MDAMNEVMIAPDFLALGLGGTNMMSMLWTVVMGRRAVGVEMRGDPFLGVHWNIREDFYHQLGLIENRVPEGAGGSEEELPFLPKSGVAGGESSFPRRLTHRHLLYLLS